MSGTLFRIALASFGVAALCLITGYSMAGSDWSRHGWHWQHGRHWFSGWGTCAATPPASVGQPDTVTLPWQNTGTLRVELSAQIDYQPGDPSQAVVTGDPSIIAHIRLADGVLSWDDDDCFTSDRPIHVHLQGGQVADWKLSGSGTLVLNALAQPTLSIDLSGSSAVAANGKVDRLNLHISGSGDADLSKLAASSASVRISGSGKAEITPRTEADLRISGSGDIRVHGNPTIRSSVSGSGRVLQAP